MLAEFRVDVRPHTYAQHQAAATKMGRCPEGDADYQKGGSAQDSVPAGIG